MALQPSRTVSSCLHCRTTVARIVAGHLLPQPRPSRVLAPAIHRACVELNSGPTRWVWTSRALLSQHPASIQPEEQRQPSQTASTVATTVEGPNNQSQQQQQQPWYLDEPGPAIPRPSLLQTPLPALPPSPPALLAPLLTYVSDTLGLDAIKILDLRPLSATGQLTAAATSSGSEDGSHVVPVPALGPNLIMLLATARSERHLHVSAGRLVRHLKASCHPRDAGVAKTVHAHGLMGPGELRIRLRRRARRRKLLGGAASADDGKDYGLTTGWICVHLGTVPDHVTLGPPETGRGVEDIAKGLESENLGGPAELEGEIVGADGKISGFGSVVKGTTIVVQLFTEARRQEMDLEGLWGDALRQHEEALKKREEAMRDPESLQREAQKMLFKRNGRPRKPRGHGQARPYSTAASSSQDQAKTYLTTASLNQGQTRTYLMASSSHGQAGIYSTASSSYGQAGTCSTASSSHGQARTYSTASLSQYRGKAFLTTASSNYGQVRTYSTTISGSPAPSLQGQPVPMPPPPKTRASSTSTTSQDDDASWPPTTAQTLATSLPEKLRLLSLLSAHIVSLPDTDAAAMLVPNSPFLRLAALGLSTPGPPGVPVPREFAEASFTLRLAIHCRARTLRVDVPSPVPTAHSAGASSPSTTSASHHGGSQSAYEHYGLESTLALLHEAQAAGFPLTRAQVLSLLTAVIGGANQEPGGVRHKRRLLAQILSMARERGGETASLLATDVEVALRLAVLRALDAIPVPADHREPDRRWALERLHADVSVLLRREAGAGGKLPCPTTDELVLLLRAYAVRERWPDFWDVFRIPPRYGLRRHARVWQAMWEAVANVEVVDDEGRVIKVGNQVMALAAMRDYWSEMLAEVAEAARDDVESTRAALAEEEGEAASVTTAGNAATTTTVSPNKADASDEDAPGGPRITHGLAAAVRAVIAVADPDAQRLVDALDALEDPAVGLAAVMQATGLGDGSTSVGGGGHGNDGPSSAAAVASLRAQQARLAAEIRSREAVGWLLQLRAAEELR